MAEVADNSCRQTSQQGEHELEQLNSPDDY